MAIPGDLKKPIDDLSSASNRLLVSCFIISISVMAGVIIYQNRVINSGSAAKDRKIEMLEMKIEVSEGRIDSLVKVSLEKSEMTNRQLQSRVALEDSLKRLLQDELNSILKKVK